MTIPVECEICMGVYAVEVETTKTHTLTCECPFCKHKEEIEFIGDRDA